jgi:hypothetical protein
MQASNMKSTLTHAWVSATGLLAADIPKQHKARTKQLCPIASCNTHKLLLSAGVEGQVRRDIVDLAVEGSPCIISLVVHAQHGWGYARKRRHSTL